MDAAGNRYFRPHRRNIDDISGQQRRIVRFVAIDQKIVEIKRRHNLPIASQFNPAHRSLFRGPAGGKQCIHQRAERADGIASWLAGIAHHINLDGTQLAHVDAEVEVAKHAPKLVLQIVIELLKVQACHLNIANLRNINIAGSIHGRVDIEIDLAPHSDQQLIAGPTT